MNIRKQWQTFWRGLIRVLILVFAGLLGLGQLQKLQLTTVSAFYYHDVVIVSIIILSLPFLQKTWKWIMQKDWARCLVRFIAVVAVSLAVAYIHNPIQTWFVGVLYFARLVLYSLFGLSLISCVRERIVRRSEILELTLF